MGKMKRCGVDGKAGKTKRTDLVGNCQIEVSRAEADLPEESEKPGVSRLSFVGWFVANKSVFASIWKRGMG